MMQILDLFSGIGGFSLGLERTGSKRLGTLEVRVVGIAEAVTCFLLLVTRGGDAIGRAHCE